jgi:cation diffusion facilitator family transporter
MGAEIGFGIASGSMALLSDGIHMGTHACALFITVLAYALARKLRRNPSFSFGTGKVGVLGGYSNAMLLGMTAILMAYESIRRLLAPEKISFDQAIIVAVLGLTVNLICAFILNGSGGSSAKKDSADGDHEKGAVLGRGHDHDHVHDANLRGALVHVVTDAMTSVLAILALLTGKYLGWAWLDAAVGLLGAALVLLWSIGLIKSSGSVLLDFGDFGKDLDAIRGAVSESGATVKDLHIWRYAEDKRSLILTVGASDGRSPDQVRSCISRVGLFDHSTVEVTKP